jgi:hypothetical protein
VKVNPSGVQRIAVAIVKSDTPRVLLADSAETLARVLALQVVAHTPPTEIASVDHLEDIRDALLAEEWGRAVELWLLATDEELDAYPDEEVLTAKSLDDERAAMEIRLAPIFDELTDGPK